MASALEFPAKGASESRQGREECDARVGAGDCRLAFWIGFRPHFVASLTKLAGFHLLDWEVDAGVAMDRQLSGMPKADRVGSLGQVGDAAKSQWTRHSRPRICINRKFHESLVRDCGTDVQQPACRDAAVRASIGAEKLPAQRWTEYLRPIVGIRTWPSCIDCMLRDCDKLLRASGTISARANHEAMSQPLRLEFWTKRQWRDAERKLQVGPHVRNTTCARRGRFRSHHRCWPKSCSATCCAQSARYKDRERGWIPSSQQ